MSPCMAVSEAIDGDTHGTHASGKALRDYARSDGSDWSVPFDGEGQNRARKNGRRVLIEMQSVYDDWERLPVAVYAPLRTKKSSVA